MATIDLGRLGFVNKGTYNNSTTYEKNDLVQFTDGGILSTYLYIDSTAQSGQAPSSSGTAGSRWVYFAKGGAAGTDGTDVAAVLNNNEIAFKTNAGALDGLAIGSAGQVLKVNSGANGYEFGEISSGQLVLIKKITPSGNVNTIEFVNGSNGVVLDGSTYGRYFFSFSGIGCQTDVNHIGIQVGTSGSYITGSNQYKWGGIDHYQSSSHSDRGNNSTFWTLGGVGTSNASGETNLSAEMWLNLNTEGGNDYPNYFCRSTYWQDNNNSVYSSFGGNLADTGTIAKIKFFFHNNYNGTSVGTLRSFENFGSITMYGLKTT